MSPATQFALVVAVTLAILGWPIPTVATLGVALLLLFIGWRVPSSEG